MKQRRRGVYVAFESSVLRTLLNEVNFAVFRVAEGGRFQATVAEIMKEFV